MANDQALVLRFGVDIGTAQKDLAALGDTVKERMDSIANSAAKSSNEVTKQFDGMATAGQKLQRVMNEGLSFQKVTTQIEGMIARTKEAQGQLQTLQSRFADLQGKFTGGQAQSFGDLGGMLMQAGSLRSAIGLAGGPIGAAALVGGVAYGQVQQYAAIGELAEKARASAREIEGLDRIFAKLGVDTGTANGIIGTFADKLRDTGQAGADFRAQLEGMGISLSNADGSARSAVAVLGDVAARIKNTADESEKLKIATAAVGDQLAGPFLSAINQSKTGLSDLSTAAREAGSSFTNDLAKGSRVAMDAISELGRQADGVYAQMKRLVGLASNLDKVKAAQQDVVNARLALDRAGTAEPWSPAGVSEHSDAPAVADKATAERDLLAAQMRLAELKRQASIEEKAIDVSRFALVNGKTVTFGDMQGPQLPPGWEKPGDDEDEPSGHGRARGGGSPAAKQSDDRAQRVLQRLQERLAATKAVTDETGTLGEKQRIVNELVNAGVTAESETGREIASLVRQIDEQAEAQRRLQSVMSEMRTAANSVESALDGWIVQGRKFDDVLKGLLKQLESQALRSAFNGLFEGGAGKGGGGLFGGLMGLIGKGFGGGYGAGDYAAAAAAAAPGAYGPGFSRGGLVGRDGEPTWIPMSFFHNAPHFADGGGIPVIAHPGEIILNRAQQMNVASGLSPKLSFKVENHVGAHIPEPSVKQTPNGLAVTMQVMDAKIAQNNDARDFARRPPRSL